MKIGLLAMLIAFSGVVSPLLLKEEGWRAAPGWCPSTKVEGEILNVEGEILNKDTTPSERNRLTPVSLSLPSSFRRRGTPRTQDSPLPDATSFLAQFRKKLHRDRTILSQYTYTEKETHTDLNSDGTPKKTEVLVYQILPGAELWQSYERLLSKDGVPLTTKELEKEDHEHDEEIQKHERKSEEQLQKDRDKDNKDEQELLDDVFAMYDIRLVNREMVNNRPTIVMTFAPRPGYKPKTGDAKLIQHVQGKVWADEEDHELVRLEAELTEPVSFGAGILAKVQKGSKVTFVRRKVNDEVWLPVRVEVDIDGRLLLFKGLHMKEIDEYSDHKKYRVETNIRFGPPL